VPFGFLIQIVRLEVLEHHVERYVKIAVVDFAVQLFG